MIVLHSTFSPMTPSSPTCSDAIENPIRNDAGLVGVEVRKLHAIEDLLTRRRFTNDIGDGFTLAIITASDQP